MRSRSLDPSEDPFSSASFLQNSDNSVLQGIGSILSWPEEPIGFSLYARWIPEKPDHGKWYLNLSYNLTDSLRVGADYRPLTDDVSLLANWRVSPENDSWRPALILGTSNDDFGDINSDSSCCSIWNCRASLRDFTFRKTPCRPPSLKRSMCPLAHQYPDA